MSGPLCWTRARTTPALLALPTWPRLCSSPGVDGPWAFLGLMGLWLARVRPALCF